MEIKAVIPGPIRPAARAIYFGLYRFAVKARCWYLDRRQQLAADHDSSLIPPALLRFRVGETTSLSRFLAVGEGTAKSIESALESLGRSFGDFQSILDFGCGCGRTLIWFAKRFPGKTLHGTDVDSASIEWCRAHLPAGRFFVNTMLPPIGYPDACFDLVYAISVFTHLSEDHQRRWISELHRVIKPGGVLLASVHGERSWTGLSLEERDILRTKGFLFKTSSKLRGVVPDWYHTAYHSREYVMRTFSPPFTALAYAGGGLGYQDMVILRK
jgi:SAM-dependent methyltransferase